MLGLSVMRVIQTTLGQFPPCDPAGDASHARLWTSWEKGQTGRGWLERRRIGASGGEMANNILITSLRTSLID